MRIWQYLLNVLNQRIQLSQRYILILLMRCIKIVATAILVLNLCHDNDFNQLILIESV